ncbi:MAG TPA: TonB family protein [Candidatus Baltobacteraceae bacterium]|nr:TonB family protein [Candidatus Baltobacteraceae bacterium]
MRTDLQRAARLTRYGGVLVIAALLLAGCGGAQGGTCTAVPIPPALAGTPIPAQPIPQNAGVTTGVSVVVSVVVDSNGNVVSDSVKSSSQNAVIDDAALALVRNSKFNPGIKACGPNAPDTTTVTVPFSPSA